MTTTPRSSRGWRAPAWPSAAPRHTCSPPGPRAVAPHDPVAPRCPTRASRGHGQRLQLRCRSTGAIRWETVVRLPGGGSLFITSFTNRDYPCAGHLLASPRGGGHQQAHRPAGTPPDPRADLQETGARFLAALARHPTVVPACHRRLLCWPGCGLVARLDPQARTTTRPCPLRAAPAGNRRPRRQRAGRRGRRSRGRDVAASRAVATGIGAWWRGAASRAAGSTRS